MVCCSRLLLRKYGNFIDNLRVFVKGGAGGMGLPRLGGQGGKGGDVWMVASKEVNLKTIKDKFPHKRFSGAAGGNSSVRSLKGMSGAACEIEVPVGIAITNDNGVKIGELDKAGDRLLVARGGHGGSFRSNFEPSKGQNKMVRLDLKLIADFGLVGFPNAGKSSLLSKLSHAKPQIADYAFTTVKPELGKIRYPDFKQLSVADLPGLIEGAHENKGMGHKFLKHVERTKQLLFVVDVHGFQLSNKTFYRTVFETIQLLTLELELYKKELLSKPALLAVNKMDLPDADNKFQALLDQLADPQKHLQSLSSDLIPSHQIEFRHILPVSAHMGTGVSQLIACLRTSIDEEAELEIQDAAQKKLESLQTSPFGTKKNTSSLSP
uniref:GTP-binding protein 10 n=1 Tax=Leptobrachium leishanense TaxID=445787 RepID=A0A8C5R0S0_9ANUR